MGNIPVLALEVVALDMLMPVFIVDQIVTPVVIPFGIITEQLPLGQ